MRIIRTVIAGLLAALLGMTTMVASPARAEQSYGERTIDEQPPSEHQVSYDTFLLKGTVTELQVDGFTYLPYATRTVQLQKKACPKASCAWKTVRKVKTNDLGKYKTKIYTPQTGRWKWRVKVKASSGYATTKGKAWTLFFS